MTLQDHSPREPVVQGWPEGGLESVPVCPLCRGRDRRLLYRGLRDRVCGCAPGQWTLYCCSACGAGYLDPRPSVSTIGLAYSRYFTHRSPGAGQPPHSIWRKYRVAQRNAYLNAFYGYELTPATRRPPRWLSNARRQRFDNYAGSLHYPGRGARLLDVGCGNGDFLLRMRSLGWEVCGVEPDPRSAAMAVAAGLDVRVGSLETQPLGKAHFDAITLTHVMEHLHDPLVALRSCLQLLKPGGVICVATPNLEGKGHRLFGADWLGLDPPRHLILFTIASLRDSLRSSGFEADPTFLVRLTAKVMFLGSKRVREGMDPMRDKPALPLRTRLQVAWLAWQADRATLVEPELTEELAVVARRPI